MVDLRPSALFQKEWKIRFFDEYSVEYSGNP